MAIYQNSIANLGVKLEITHASPDIANNRTTITYKASVYKTGSHNPWNLLSSTPQYLTINGQPLHSTATGNYDLRGGTYQQLIKSGTLVVPHNSDGTKSFNFSWNVNFTNTGYGYGNVTASGTYTLPTIARASTFTIPSTTITTGSAFTVTINKASDGFRHKVAYIVGSSVNEWITNANTSYSATVPHSLFNAHKSTASVSGVIRVTTMNGSVEVGSNQKAVTINLTSGALPSLGTISIANTNRYVFKSDEQFVRGMSRLTCTANSAIGSYSSSISAYEFRVLRANGTTTFGTTSKTENTHQFPVFDFPASSSEVVTPQVRVKDSRGRYSAWKNASGIRVHYYAPPAIGTMTVRRTGSGNTTLQVTRNYSISLLYQGGAGSNLNTASLWFQHRTKGSTTATNNTGAKSTTTSLTNSNANLAGTFAANTSYEVRAILDDGVAGRVIGSWISVGTEFVPMDIGPKGVGVGKIHDNGGYNLQVGSGGIKSEGDISFQGKSIQLHPLTHPTSSAAITVTGNWNDVIKTGFYQGSGMTNQSPGSHSWKWVRVTRHNDLYILQESVDFSGSGSYYRVKNNGTWTGWKNLDPSAHFISKPNSSTHVNSMVKSGAYRMAGDNPNMFPNGAWSQMLTIRGGDDTIAQMGFPYQGGRPSIRSGNPSDVGGKGSWNSWKELAWHNDVPKITSGTNANGNWYNINGVLLICWYRFSITGKLTNSQMNGSWTYPMPYAFAPAVSIGSRADSDPSSTAGYRRAGTTAFHQYNESATKTDILYAVNNGDVPASPQKYLNIFAMGTPA